MERAELIVRFWLGDPEDQETYPEEHAKLWWSKDPSLDATIRERFEADLDGAVAGEAEDWLESPRGRLAFVILLDQFSRNMFRDTPRAFSQDRLALGACLEGMQRGHDRELGALERAFFYMPLIHAEDVRVQERSVMTFEELAEGAPAALRAKLASWLDSAIRHYQIVRRFGRFPHRNRILGRPSTPEEVEFLAQPGSSF